MTPSARVVGVLLVAGAVVRAWPGARTPAVAPPDDLAARPAPNAVVASLRVALQSAQAGARSANPLDGSPRAIADGAKLYVAYNCVDCHGADGSGLMAPSLNDNRWRYGGSAAEVFASISGGRPEGMPVWSRYLSADQIWRLTAYVSSLGTGKDVATLSFTDLGVKRAGH